MIRYSFLAAALLVGVAAVQAQAQRQGLPSIGPGTANPSAIVAAELGLARLVREKGQWTAFRETAEKDAVLFMPSVLNAPSWLKQQTDPAEPMRWSPQSVFIACDGSYAAATGPVERADGSRGSFVTIWRQQRKGDYKWVVTFAGDTPPPPPRLEGAINATVATCPPAKVLMTDREWREERKRERRRPDVVRIPDPPPANGSGQSPDGTLRWSWTQNGSTRAINVMLRRPDGEERVISETASMTAP